MPARTSPMHGHRSALSAGTIEWLSFPLLPAPTPCAGNVVFLPVLGVQLLFHLQPSPASRAAATSLAGTVGNEQRSSVGQLQQVCPLLITSSTRMQLQQPTTAASQQAAADAATATSGQQPAPADSSSGASLLQARVEAARKAAQQAEVSSSHEAAMDAAERAVRAGA